MSYFKAKPNQIGMREVISYNGNFVLHLRSVIQSI